MREGGRVGGVNCNSARSTAERRTSIRHRRQMCHSISPERFSSRVANVVDQNPRIAYLEKHEIFFGDEEAVFLAVLPEGETSRQFFQQHDFRRNPAHVIQGDFLALRGSEDLALRPLKIPQCARGNLDAAGFQIPSFRQASAAGIPSPRKNCDSASASASSISCFSF